MRKLGYRGNSLEVICWNRNSFKAVSYSFHHHNVRLLLLLNILSSKGIFQNYTESVCISVLGHMEVPRLGVKSELQLPVYATAMAMLDLKSICNLHCSLHQHWILNPLSDARDQTCILMDTRLGS